MRGKDIPCYQCKDRVVGCHSTCPKYIEFRKGREKVYKEREHNLTDKVIEVERSRRIAKLRGRKRVMH